MEKIAIVLCVALFVLGGLLGAFLKPSEIQEIEVPVEVIKEVQVEVPVEVAVEGENYGVLLSYIYDNEGNLSLLDVDDLDEDEISQVIERISFIEVLKAKALEYVKAELFDEADKEVVGAYTIDEDELERLKLDNDADEVLVSNIDFEDSDATVTVTGTFEQDDVKFEFEAEVEFKDGEIEDFSIESIIVA